MKTSLLETNNFNSLKPADSTTRSPMAKALKNTSDSSIVYIPPEALQELSQETSRRSSLETESLLNYFKLDNDKPNKSAFAVAFDSFVEKTATQYKPVHCSNTMNSGEQGLSENFNNNANKVKALLKKDTIEKFNELLNNKDTNIKLELKYFLTSMSLFSKENLNASNINARAEELYTLSKIENKHSSAYRTKKEKLHKNINEDLKTYLSADKNQLEKKISDFIDTEVFNKDHKKHISWLKNNGEKIFNGGGPYIMNAIESRLKNFDNHNLSEKITGLVEETFVLRDILNINSTKKKSDDDNGNAKAEDPHSADNKKVPLIKGHGNQSKFSKNKGIIINGDGNKIYINTPGKIRRVNLVKPMLRRGNEAKRIIPQYHGIIASVVPVPERKDKVISIGQASKENSVVLYDGRSAISAEPLSLRQENAASQEPVPLPWKNAISQEPVPLRWKSAISEAPVPLRWRNAVSEQPVPRSWIATASSQPGLKAPEQIVSVNKRPLPSAHLQSVKASQFTKMNPAGRLVEKKSADNPDRKQVKNYTNPTETEAEALLRDLNKNDSKMVSYYLSDDQILDTENVLLKRNTQPSDALPPDQAINPKPIKKPVSRQDYADRVQNRAARLRANSAS